MLARPLARGLAGGGTIRSRSSKRRGAEQLLPEAASLLAQAGVRRRQDGRVSVWVGAAEGGGEEGSR